MMKRVTGFFVASVLALTGAIAQDKKTESKADDKFVMSVALLDPEWALKIGATESQDVMVKQIADVGNAVAEKVEALSRPDQAVVVRVTLQKAKAEVEIFAQPDIPAAELKKVRETIEKIETPHLTQGEFRLQFQFIRGTPPQPKGDENWPPGSETRSVMRAREYAKLDLAGKAQFLQNWARIEVLPVLGSYQRSAPAEFEGVIRMGKLLGETDFSKPLDINKLINSNSDYWRGVLEMNQGNPLVSATRVFMEAANGNHDQAMLFASLQAPLFDHEAVPSQFIAEFMELYSQLRGEVNTHILGAIAKFDTGDYQGAARGCENLLRQYPRSAWARYELWFSRQQIEKATGTAPEGSLTWPEARKVIYSMDSMYPMAVEATNESEAYELYRRLQLKDEKPPANGQEFIDAFRTDIAFDLGEFAYSAEAYWIAFSNFKPEAYEPRPVMEFSLYSISKLGAKELAEKVGKNFEVIEKTALDHLKSRYESSPVFKAFRKTEKAQ